MKENNKQCVLFFSEAVTLAHMARIAVLVKTLNPEQYQVHLACDPRYIKLFADLKVNLHHIDSISSLSFLDALAKGNPIYKSDTLVNYVKQDLQVIEAIKPDVIIGDFRLSLSISARLAKIPYATVTNSYWSPYAQHKFPLPDHPMEKVLGATMGQKVFNLVRPVIFAYHCLAMNKARKHFALPALGYNLARVYTDADYVLYADIAELIQMQDLPNNHMHIGPLLWSPAIDLPAWWPEVKQSNNPVIYVTLGSSGQTTLLPAILAACESLNVSVIVSTAGRCDLESIPENAYVTDYLPGYEATHAAALVICNGGSLTTQQAMMLGKPVLGVVSNMDQHFNMAAIEAAGAGILLRAYKAETKIAGLVKTMLDDVVYTKQAQALATQHTAYQASEKFKKFLQLF